MIIARLLLPTLLAGSLLGSLLACAAPCEKVQDSHTAFRKATLPTAAGARATPDSSDNQPHLRLSVPYEVLDAMIAKELGRIPKLDIPLPEVAGASLGRLKLGVETVRLQQAPAGELGVRVGIGLREGKRLVLVVDVDARLRPRLNPNAGTVAVALAGRDIIELRPSISKQSRKQLGDWIWSKLPDAAKMFVDRNTVTNLAGELADELMRQAASKLERELLDELGELVDFEFDLPEELPVRSIALRSDARYLDIDLHTSLRVEHGLAPDRGRDEAMHPNLIQARLAGDAIAALANHAIREGRIPGRYTLEGEPDPSGDVHAGVGWANGKPDALEIHLFKFESDCAHVVLRGVPKLAVEGRQLVLGTEQAKVESVIGSAKIRAGLFFSKTARRGIELLERTAASTEVEVGSVAMTANIADAKIVADEVVLGLRLSPTR
jgi:hypothetical protein